MTAKLDGTNGLIQSYGYIDNTTTPVAATNGFNYTFTPSSTGTVLVMNPAGTLATGTITMPASPVDGMTITFSSTKIITALTVNANTGQTINNAVTTLAAGQSASYVYRAASTAWFPFTNVATTSSYTGVASTQFTSSGTFTIPAGITKCKVTVVGGGGGGSSASSTGGATSFGTGGAGGGGGGAAIKYLSGLTPGNTLTVTVGGAGGTSSVASGTQTITTVSATGNAGIGSNGDINIRGGAGGNGSNTANNWGGTNASGGNGGTSIMGGGGSGATSGNGGAGGAYGGGGGGGAAVFVCGSWSNGSGGAGAGGIVLFEY